MPWHWTVVTVSSTSVPFRVDPHGCGLFKSVSSDGVAMSTTIRNVTIKCLSCKSILNATARVDNQTGKVMNYIEIHKGKRLTSPGIHGCSTSKVPGLLILNER
jgi:hypothetical protein